VLGICVAKTAARAGLKAQGVRAKMHEKSNKTQTPLDVLNRDIIAAFAVIVLQNLMDGGRRDTHLFADLANIKILS
jgi:hypothetical protein